MNEYVPLGDFDYSWFDNEGGDIEELMDELDVILMVEDDVDKVIERYNA